MPGVPVPLSARPAVSLLPRLRLTGGCVLALFLFSHGCPAQEVYGALRPAATRMDTLRRLNIASISFEKSINTYHWNAFGFYQNYWGPLSVRLGERFVSTLIQTERKLITYEHTLDLSLQRRLTDGIAAGMKASFFSLSDNKNIGISDASSQALYGGISIQPESRINIDPFIGIRYDHQIDQRDHGPSYLVDFGARGLEYNGYRTFLTGEWQYDNLKPRILETRNTVLSVEKVFFEETRNMLRVGYNRNRRDFYFPADSSVERQYNTSHNIETRTDDALTVFDSLGYGLAKNLSMAFEGNIFTRSVGREDRLRTASSQQISPNTQINELRLEGALQMDYTPWNSLHGMARISYQEREEDHNVEGASQAALSNSNSAAGFEERKNNHSKRTSIATNISLGYSPSDTVWLSGSGSILRYDTPSALNDDDRDELWYILSLTSLHRLNQHFSLWLQGNVNLTHLVYLFSSRSADNSWNRVFRLAPRLLYMPSGDFTSVNTFEVLANYSVYDFEYPSSPIRSFAFRQFAFIDSTGLNLTQRLSIGWFSHIKLYEQGELRWDDFSERPSTYSEDRTYLGTVQYLLGRGLLFSAGIRYFSQRRYVFTGQERTLNGYLRSIGPVTSIVWNVSEHTEFSTKGWFENQTQTESQSRSFANMTMSLIVHM
ncbi:MAG: hypothetical protein E6K56_02065 [Ignavibacteria bacterium]|nr:MAG: hypothetical protein E6K56_02065 [Ignavibacteria bacterium]